MSQIKGEKVLTDGLKDRVVKVNLLGQVTRDDSKVDLLGAANVDHNGVRLAWAGWLILLLVHVQGQLNLAARDITSGP